MSEKFKHFMRFGHIPLLILLQVIFIILFATFVVYDPKSVQPHGSTKTYNLTKHDSVALPVPNIVLETDFGYP